jgi:hypothetical protein
MPKVMNAANFTTLENIISKNIQEDEKVLWDFKDICRSNLEKHGE